MEPIRVIERGAGPGPVVVLHGGPGAIGSAGPLARALAVQFRVHEPLQRQSGDVPLGVQRHIDDLSEVIDRHAGGERVVLVGESWGAMLALAFAAQGIERVRAIGLVGCGTFDPGARAALLETLAARRTPELETALRNLGDEEVSESERFARAHRLSLGLYTYARDPKAEDGAVHVDAAGHLESWNDMVRLQQAGVYPAAFRVVTCPVAMFHGDFDPHPGRLIRDSLRPHLPQLEYHEFERCGHDPLVEQHARLQYLETLGGWLATQLKDPIGAD